MKFFILVLLVLCGIGHADQETSAWSDIKSGTMKVIRGGSKAVKKAATKVDEKIEENQKEDEDEARAEEEKAKKVKKSKKKEKEKE